MLPYDTHEPTLFFKIKHIPKKSFQIYKHNVEQKTPHKKEVILYDSVYMKNENMAKPIGDVRVKTVVASAGSRV